MSVTAESVGQLAFLKNAPSRVRAELRRIAVSKKFAAGEMLAMEGAEMHFFFVVLSGSIRVYKLGESGREITLYRVQSRESCVLTTFGVLSHTPFPAFAVAETDLEVLLVPAEVLREWVQKYEVWRNHVFVNLSRRLREILQTIENAVFQRLDVRVAQYLLTHFPEDLRIIKITHEKLARELGSSRVPVSRVLEAFAAEGLIELARGKIVIKNRRKLLEKGRGGSPGG